MGTGTQSQKNTNKEKDMKNMKKIMSLFLALVMLVGVALPSVAMAEEAKTKIVVHKVLMSKEDFNKFGDPKEHNGKEIPSITDYFGKSATAAKDVAFRIYEVKDEATAGFIKGDDTTLAKYSADLDASKYYKLIKTSDDPAKEFFITDANGKFEASLSNGNYRIIEDKENSTYNKNLTGMKAVPFDLKLPAGKPDGSGNFSEADPLHIYPKNTENKVQFDKNFAKENGLEAVTDPKQNKDIGAVVEKYKDEKAKATATVGREIPYQSLTKLPKETFLRNLNLTDTFDRGMEYVEESLVVKALKLKTAGAEGKPEDNVYEDLTGVTFAKGTDYTIQEKSYGFELNFTDAGLKKLNDAAKTQDIYVEFTYKGKVTTDAVIDDEIDNNVTLTYNHEPPKPSPETKPSENGEIEIVKNWSGDKKAEKVKYVLIQGDKVVADVTLKSTTTNGEIDLGNNIKFNVTGEFAGKFTGLDKDKNYKVLEFVDGYAPEFNKTAETGKITIKNNDNPTSITPEPPKVVTGGKKFVKTNNDGTENLEGAEFLVYKNVDNAKKYLKLKDQNGQAQDKAAYEQAQKKYIDAVNRSNELNAKTEKTEAEKEELQKLEGTGEGSIAKLKEARNTAYEAFKFEWDWTDTESEAFKFISGKNGQFEVKGLEYNKTGDAYHLKEVKAPAGYELPSNADDIASFVVAKGSYAGKLSGEGQPDHVDYKLENDTQDGQGQQIKNIKVSIPKTGGIGTVIFTVVGISLMAGAFIAMRKRTAEEN